MESCNRLFEPPGPAHEHVQVLTQVQTVSGDIVIEGPKQPTRGRIHRIHTGFAREDHIFKALALVVFASWRPSKALLGALLFGAFDALQVRLQQVIGGVPYQVFLMLPYVLSILALIVMSRRAGYPRALMVPYRKGER